MRFICHFRLGRFCCLIVILTGSFDIKYMGDFEELLMHGYHLYGFKRKCMFQNIIYNLYIS